MPDYVLDDSDDDLDEDDDEDIDDEDSDGDDEEDEDDEDVETWQVGPDRSRSAKRRSVVDFRQ